MLEHLKLKVILSTVIVLTLLALSNIVLVLLIYSPAYAQNINNNTNKLAITDGIASGDITDRTATIWSRANTQAQMNVQYDTTLSFSHAKSKTVLVNHTTDFAGHVKLDSLSPDILYYYRVWFSGNSNKNKTMTTTPAVVAADANSSSSSSIIGTFRTAPDHLTSSNSRPIS